MPPTETEKEAIKSVTFYLSNDVLETLLKDADKKQVSLNILVEHIFRNYIDWDALAVEAGWGVIQNSILKEAFDRLDKQALKEIAIRAAVASRDTRLLMMGNDTIEAFYAILKSRLSKSGFKFNELKNHRQRIFVINHTMGEKWSIFFKWYYESTLLDLGHHVDIEYDDNMLRMIIWEDH